MGKKLRAHYDGAQIAARFDNARQTLDSASLFRNVDSLAATSALDPATRKTIRERARYVVSNVPYAWSMLSTYVTHIVGPWATVSFPRGGIPEALRDEVTDAFDAWAMATDFWSKVKTLLRAKVTDGEAFALFTTDKKIVTDENRVTLNLRPIECDRIESWPEMVSRENENDGIRFDENGHPTEYRVLKYHPGDYRSIKNIKTRAGDWLRAANVIHYFDALRPEQVRGVSDFVSALDIPALQKSYRASVVDTAINAASISGVLSTDQIPECFDDDGTSIGKCAVDVKPNTAIQTQRGSLVTLPEGWRLQQLSAEQPTSLYPEFVRQLIAEMAACLNMPVNIAMCDSSQHNFASAKLDHMTYGDKIASVRSVLSVKVLDRVFFKWLEEYAVIRHIDRATVRALHKTEWLFKESQNSDVMKDASADNTRLMNGTATYESICGKRGVDYKRFVEQGIHERVMMLKVWRDECVAAGLSPDTPCPFATIKADAPSAPTEDEVEHEAEKSAAPRKTNSSKGM